MPWSLSDNKAVIRRSMVDLREGGNLSLIDECYSPHYVGHDPNNPHVTTLADTAAFVEELHQGYADIVVTIDDQIAEGDRVATRWTFRGTDTGAFPPHAAGAAVTIAGITISRLHDGKIVEEWAEWDAAGLQRQRGPSPATA